MLAVRISPSPVQLTLRVLPPCIANEGLQRSDRRTVRLGEVGLRRAAQSAQSPSRSPLEPFLSAHPRSGKSLQISGVSSSPGSGDGSHALSLSRNARAGPAGRTGEAPTPSDGLRGVPSPPPPIPPPAMRPGAGRPGSTPSGRPDLARLGLLHSLSALFGRVNAIITWLPRWLVVGGMAPSRHEEEAKRRRRGQTISGSADEATASPLSLRQIDQKLEDVRPVIEVK
ncbi:hypothetical protein THAOC_24686, partial [Thalassiosira oceanica]